MNKKIDASLQKRIQRRICELQLELDKSEELIRFLERIQEEFRGFEKLESCVTKVEDQKKLVREKQEQAKNAIRTFEGCKDRNEALEQLSKSQNFNSHKEIETGNQTIVKQGKHFKSSWKGDKKFLKAVEKSRKAGYTGGLTFFQ